MINSRSIHVAANGIIPFFLLLTSVSMYTHICVCIYIYVHHIFFICSSVNVHLGCFHVLPIVNSVANEQRVDVPLQIIILSG